VCIGSKKNDAEMEDLAGTMRRAEGRRIGERDGGDCSGGAISQIQPSHLLEFVASQSIMIRYKRESQPAMVLAEESGVRMHTDREVRITSHPESMDWKKKRGEG
jgi:hypothetical protein